MVTPIWLRCDYQTPLLTVKDINSLLDPMYLKEIIDFQIHMFILCAQNPTAS